jgi:hypothetical protein
MRLAVAVCLSGCFYPGRFHDLTGSFVGKRVQVGCLDVAVTLTDDQTATWPVVQYTFGNRCTHDAIVDLGAVRAIGRSTDHPDRELHAFDPRHELRPLPIDGWWYASERIEYVADGDPTPPHIVCIDVGAVEKVAAPQAQWICLGASDGGES